MSIKILTEKVSEDIGLSQKDAKYFIEKIFANITTQLKSGSEISIPGFGKFCTVTQAAKSGVMANKSWTSPEKQVPKFKAAKALKDTLA